MQKQIVFNTLLNKKSGTKNPLHIYICKMYYSTVTDFARFLG